MAKTYIGQEKSTYHIEVSEPPVPIEPEVDGAYAGRIRFTNFRCWTHGWERLSVQEADGMTPSEIAGRLLEMGGDDSFFAKMSDDSSVRLILSKTYLLRKNGKEHSEFPTVFETTLGVLRQANLELKRITSAT